MEFLGLGAGEIIVILLIAFIVFGPERLVGIARTLGRISHQISQAGRDFNRQLQQEISLDEQPQKGTKLPEKRSDNKPAPSQPKQP